MAAVVSFLSKSSNMSGPLDLSSSNIKYAELSTFSFELPALAVFRLELRLQAGVVLFKWCKMPDRRIAARSVLRSGA